MELWVGCVAGALTENEFTTYLARPGFEQIAIEPTRIYEFEDAKAFLGVAGLIPRCLPARWVAASWARSSAPASRDRQHSAGDAGDFAGVVRLLQAADLPTAGLCRRCRTSWWQKTGAGSSGPSASRCMGSTPFCVRPW